MGPRMLIATRFGLGIQDPTWFEHRFVLLTAITMPSLMAQEDQSFEWVLRVDASLPEAVHTKLTELISPFEGRAHICPNNHAALMTLVEDRDLSDSSGRLLVGRIDDDDAWDRHTVADVRSRVERWSRKNNATVGYGLSFETGLVWLMYDMIEMDQLWRRGVLVTCEAAVKAYRYPFTSISGYAYAAAADALTTLYTGHAEVADLMKEREYTIDVVATDHPRWLYCRHKQADSSVDRGEGPDLGIKVSDMAAMFGIDKVRAQRYIESNQQYGYCRVMQKFDKRGQLIRELQKLDQEIQQDGSRSANNAGLQSERLKLMAKLEDLSTNVVGD